MAAGEIAGTYDFSLALRGDYDFGGKVAICDP
jgi:hypothetical protein